MSESALKAAEAKGAKRARSRSNSREASMTRGARSRSNSREAKKPKNARSRSNSRQMSPSPRRDHLNAQNAIRDLLTEAAHKYENDTDKNSPEDGNDADKGISKDEDDSDEDMSKDKGDTNEGICDLAEAVVDQVFTMVVCDDELFIAFVQKVTPLFETILAQSVDGAWLNRFIRTLGTKTTARMESVREPLKPHLGKLREYVRNPDENESKVDQYLKLVRDFGRAEYWRLSVILYDVANKDDDEVRLHRLIERADDDESDLVNFAYELIRHIGDDIEFTVATHVD